MTDFDLHAVTREVIATRDEWTLDDLTARVFDATPRGAVREAYATALREFVRQQLPHTDSRLGQIMTAPRPPARASHARHVERDSQGFVDRVPQAAQPDGGVVMTALPLPQWLRDGEPAVAYFPRRDAALAEAWPVLNWTRTDSQVVAQTEVGEIRFRLWDYGIDVPTQIGANPVHAAKLIPVSDPRALAAEDRTQVMRAVNRLTKTIRDNRPDGLMASEDILKAVVEIHAVAGDVATDIAATIADAMMAKRS